jgi:hypothetical protein
MHSLVHLSSTDRGSPAILLGRIGIDRCEVFAQFAIIVIVIRKVAQRAISASECVAG